MKRSGLAATAALAGVVGFSGAARAATLAVSTNKTTYAVASRSR